LLKKKYLLPLFNTKDKNQEKILCDRTQFQKVVHHEYTKLFVNLQVFIVGKKFVVKEVLRKEAILSHYIFTCPIPWNILTKSEKYCASWLNAYHHGLQ